MAATRVSAKRYGVRYGRKNREKIGKIEQEARDSNKCPYCHYEGKVSRLAAGIYFCKKCSSKFTGRAYVIGKRVEADTLKVEAEEKMVVPHADVKEEDFEQPAPIADSDSFGEELDSEDFGDEVKV